MNNLFYSKRYRNGEKSNLGKGDLTRQKIDYLHSIGYDKNDLEKLFIHKQNIMPKKGWKSSIKGKTLGPRSDIKSNRIDPGLDGIKDMTKNNAKIFIKNYIEEDSINIDILAGKIWDMYQNSNNDSKYTINEIKILKSDLETSNKIIKSQTQEIIEQKKQIEELKTQNTTTQLQELQRGVLEENLHEEVVKKMVGLEIFENPFGDKMYSLDIDGKNYLVMAQSLFLKK